MQIELNKMPAFGVAGNFTGHLEQAGEAGDFANVITKEQNAPKAIFPTYIPLQNAIANKNKIDGIPSYLKVFPFDSQKIVFPQGQQNLQVESECAIICDAVWESTDNGKKLKELKPIAFGASNDCSIRKEGAKKISEKKNWGSSSKGLSENLIPIESFDSSSKINDYRIASYLLRNGKLIEYGENSAVRDYSYMYAKLLDWMVEKFNCQRCEGPAENIGEYLAVAGYPSQIMVSIGATRYTDFGEHNYLANGDDALIILYNEKHYSKEQIEKMLLAGDLCNDEISFLKQKIQF